ncbi:MAG: hypothetical protein JHC98_07455 [Thermoleophilaceae bacterium]|nr:hypothetical protein [Thermoleophilaceae bacterium]
MVFVRSFKSIALTVLVMLSLGAASAAAATPSVKVALDYACALSEAGTVSCWGSNFRGQLGDGTRTDSSVPVAVQNVANATQLDVGMYGACALIADGTVKCWGSNEYGALGSAASYATVTPTTVTGISGAVKVSVGEATICALLASPAGTVKCWGYGSSGQLGVVAPPSSTSTPQTITTLGGPATDIAVADFHACAVVAGALKCWGANYSKQIQDSATLQFDTPVLVNGLSSGVAQPAPGINHTCVIMTTGAIKCWGANFSGQDGTGLSGNNTTSPQNNLITSGASFVGYGEDFHCALVGDVGKCWGGNAYGQLGDGTTDSRPAPTIPIGLGSGVTSIDAGGSNACAIVSKVVKCWGPNESGALGNGTSSNQHSPVDVPNVTGATDVDVSTSHACAIASSALKCWGSGGSGQLGTGNTSSAPTPVAATAFTGTPTGVATIASTTCAVFAAGIKCIGNGTDGELGNNSTSNSPTTTVNTSPALAAAPRIDGRGDMFCAVDGGLVYCWGTNADSRLGQGAGQNFATLAMLDNPTAVPGIASGATSVAVGYRHVCAVVSGALHCWGRNSNGEVNGNTSTTGEIPVQQTPGVSGVSSGTRAVAAAYGTTCAIVTSPSGGVKCFGAGGSGQLGNGSLASSATEVNVTGISGATQLAASDSSFCALIAGAVKCWGWNSAGELGDGTNAKSSTPVSVLGITNATDISGQGGTFCAALSTGGVKCWGNGTTNQLGIGSAIFSATPSAVLGLSLFPPDPLPTYVKQKIKATLKLNGKIKKSGKKLIKVPLKLFYVAPVGSSAATVCGGTTTISVKTSKKKTTKLKAKFKRKGANCSYSGTIKLPKSFRGKKIKFTVSMPGNADVFKYKSTKTLKLK